MALFGIDVSDYQGQIDWNTVKPQISFAILKIGYGDDYTYQDDQYISRNISECERLGIPYGLYIYSYAQNTIQVDSEVAHILRIANGHHPVCLYYDVEDNSQQQFSKSTITSWVMRFCSAVTSAGYKAGAYTYASWFDNKIDIYQVYNAGYSVWVAQTPNPPHWDGINYDIWQYGQQSMSGIGGSGNVDVNYCYNEALLNVIITPFGTIDEATPDFVRGWATTNRPNISATIKIYAQKDGSTTPIYLGVGTANQYREDLQAYFGYNISVDIAQYGYGQYTVTAFAVGDNLNPDTLYALNNPKTVTISEPPQPESRSICLWLSATIARLFRNEEDNN